MIGLTSGKIAVDPIFYKSETEGGNKLTQAEKDYLDSIGQTYTDSTPSLRLPDSAIQKCNQGIVKYVANDVPAKWDINIGDYVIFSGWTGTTVRLEGEGLLILLGADFAVCKVLPPETDIPGLYFKDAQGNYWIATHEMAINFISRAMEDLQLVKVSDFKPDKIARAGASNE